MREKGLAAYTVLKKCPNPNPGRRAPKINK